jgi:cell wall-associated NlpC family hydrolase
MESSSLKPSLLKTFPMLEIKLKTSEEFLESYLGTPYYWGGLSKLGIDCSGLSQLYYLEVLNKILPKNSRDQRKLLISKDRTQLKNHDLVFCFPKSKPDFHHVAVYYEHRLWHSSRTGGVKAQVWEDFEIGYSVEDMGSIVL